MNRRRRNVLNVILDCLIKLADITDKAEALKVLNDALEKVSDTLADEEMAKDNLPETLQFSTMYENLSDNVDDLYDAEGELEVAIETCTDNEVYNYADIKAEIVSAVNSIKTAMHR